jgi:hypothetical protein
MGSKASAAYKISVLWNIFGFLTLIFIFIAILHRLLAWKFNRTAVQTRKDK